ncbi:(2Fe-2S)-binding protein [Neobacillus sp. NPDC058068]|uniref:putative iron-sulfur cluster-binding metallochaperone n=1 Tax=Neobacillus sp. NPDC058068 TaxID=3346325 RepID=UPI0036DE6595
MSDCCKTNDSLSEKLQSCSSCGVVGKKVKTITLKTMLKPSSLELLNAELDHYFCATANCEIVYYNSEIKSYSISEIKVPVFQKESLLDTPVCYCFNWTKERIQTSIENGLTPHPVEHIRENIKANRCGCEVNNPQGSCCLANVTKFSSQFGG